MDISLVNLSICLAGKTKPDAIFRFLLSQILLKWLENEVPFGISDYSQSNCEMAFQRLQKMGFKVTYKFEGAGEDDQNIKVQGKICW